MTMLEVVITRIRASLAPVVHCDRTVTPIVLLETTAKSNPKPIGSKLAILVSGGDPARPLTLKNLEAFRKFLAKVH